MSMTNYILCLTGMAFQNHLKSATRHLLFCGSYPVAYHITVTTNILNVTLKKPISHTATKGELTVFLSKELLDSKKRPRSFIPLHGKIKQRHHIGMGCKQSQQK